MAGISDKALPLAWAIDIASLRQYPAEFSFEANAEELKALKTYLDVEDLSGFKSSVTVKRLTEGKFGVTGQFSASVKQLSVVSLDQVSTTIDEEFSVEYWPSELIGADPTVASPFDQESPEPIVDGQLPIGTLLCELLAISIDPYPRNEGDVLEWSFSPEEDRDANPFAELNRLQQR